MRDGDYDSIFDELWRSDEDTDVRVRVDWNPDGNVDRVVVTDEWSGKPLVTLEDLGDGEWDLHVGPLHLSLGRRGLVIDAPAGMERPK